MTTVYWTGDVPTHCQLTDEPITDTFIDGATKRGPWCLMSPYAHARFGRGLGVGRGQKYQRQPDGRWAKVAG